MKTSRRSFLRHAALAAGVAALSPRSEAQTPGANDDIRLAVIGFHSRGKDHIKELNEIKGARITALCDVDRDVLDWGVAEFRKKGREVEAYTDIRQLLESKNVDAVTIATPNHWHALAAIWSIQAGKDVYLEKPVSHTVWEGRRIVAAARQHNKIVQTGTQSRSSEGLREAVEWVRQGNLGKIKVSRGLCYKPRPSIGKTSSPLPIPASVDYDLWSGPAPVVPPHRSKFHYDWHWFWSYGDGDIGNQGIHEMDVARWFLGEPALSPRVLTVGGRFGYVDDGETPNTLFSIHDYERAPLIMEVRGLPARAGAKEMDAYEGATIGVVVDCEGGYVVVPDYRSAKAFSPDGKLIKSFEGASSHFENFLKAVRSRKETDLHAPILDGHLSSALCHTSNISYRVGQTQPAAAVREDLKSNTAASATLARMTEHLAANGVNLESTPLHLGLHLQMDPASEQFTAPLQANVFLSRVYRVPFVVT
ncbi:MAG TPA: Gfo/Idh/MocA family oxidoreductase [Verrucomicrobiae bacterium]|jgi:predicted dehydrogenase|nr:Gfo/Idh/MocA family oxidoreductase [Verrucomicrobiae bacterium]